MLKNMNHLQGVIRGEEILFDTPFGYIFDYLCHNDACKLPLKPVTPHPRGGNNIVPYLKDLGQAMADPTVPLDESLDSETPAFFTYLGQFIDHDITARTDRDIDGTVFRIEPADHLTPLAPETVLDKLKNGRRPNLDLDSVFGDGPSFSPESYRTEAYELYVDDNKSDSLKMKLNRPRRSYIDLPRIPGRDGRALIADHRNDENVMISQLHAAFIAFYNRVYDDLELPSEQAKYSRARQLTTWAYQYGIIHDYLPRVCDPLVVADILVNGPLYFGQFTNTIMPLEFSVAGFRFGHSMIRPSYTINGTTRSITELLGLSGGRNELLTSDPLRELKEENVIKWSEFIKINKKPEPQMARKIDTKIAKGLFTLDQAFGSVSPGSVLAHLTQRNLLRGFLLSLPTGQSVAKAMRIFPMTDTEIQQSNPDSENQILANSGLLRRTPLWYYVLKEAEVQQQSMRMGVVGSKIVAETLIGLIKRDPNSYLNNMDDPAVQPNGIKVPFFKGGAIKSFANFLKHAEVPL
ncbi:MAG: heme peroxidase family protein [Bacteroidota bacterium]